MFRMMTAALLLLAQTAVASAATCAGANPAIVSVVVTGVDKSGTFNRYEMSGKVVNLGSTGQASNVLQFVDIYEGSTKLDDRGIPPLKAGQSYTFGYVSSRSHGAGKGTTKLTFQIDMRNGSQDCNASNGRFSLTF